MFRLANLLVVVLALGIAYLLWKPLLVGSPMGPRRVLPDTDLVAGSHLDRRLPEINFKDNELADVIDFMRDVTDSFISVEWGALEAAGIHKDLKVSLQLKDTRWSEALDIILAYVGDRSAPLASEVVDGVMIITTKAAINHGFTTRRYDLSDLVNRETDPLVIAFGCNPFRFTEETPQARMDGFTQRIQLEHGAESLVDPVTYFRPGSWGNVVVPYNVIVRETRAKHQQIAADFEVRRWLPNVEAFGLRLAVLVLGLLIALRIAASPGRRRRHRLLKGLCVCCGYDLRATPQRCPECGRIPQFSQTPEPA